MKSSVRFIIENARCVRTHVCGKVTFITLLTAGYKAGSVEYWDVTTFSKDTTDQAPPDGASVTVKGSLSRRKPQDGSRGWTTELVARSIEPGDESLTVAMPAGKKPVASTPAPEYDDQIPF